MANFKGFLFYFIYALCVFPLGLWSVVAIEDRKVYIAYMGSVSEEYSLSSEDHVGILQQIIQGSYAEESLIRSYGRSFNGFAANLTEKESEILKKMEGVVSVFPSRTLHVQTTRSWDFLGFAETAHKNVSAESDTIIGVIDTGIYPESPSFNDDGFGPAPKKWKGVCEGGQNFTCNNKLIGARTYIKSKSARDVDGHGTHTASIAAGRKVDDTSFYGLARGSARGGVPSARIAAYGVCDESDCSDSNVMAAFDDAIADGVDLITVSLGGDAAMPFYSDVIAIGGFHAMDKGILTVQAAGNSGNISGSTDSVAPWIFSTAASSMDRRILTKVVLGDGKELLGDSVNSFSLKGDKFPLLYGEAASFDKSLCSKSGRLCDCLDPKKVKGKIVVCDDAMGVNSAFEKGALGAVALALSADEDNSFVVPLPAALLPSNKYHEIQSYLNSTKAPEANILKSETFNDTTAPVVVFFSSRGPNVIAPDILKPDITAPGVEILAAYSPIGRVSYENADKRSVKYNIISGTSMSCPHVTGAAAYLKSLHPDWSPSAIKSALMTTAHPMSPSKNPDAEFAYGAGHLNPMGATNPGLVYEATKGDYIRFLCNLGYKEQQIRLISGDKSSSCPKKIVQHMYALDVNYPSIATKVSSGKSFSVKFQRTVTNVGVANSTYIAKIESGSNINVTVEPDSLSFKSLKEQKSFTVTVLGKGLSVKSQVSASLVWSDGIYSVRSPIVIYSR